MFYSFKFGIFSSQEAPVVTSTFRVSIPLLKRINWEFWGGKETFVNLYWNCKHSLHIPWLFLYIKKTTEVITPHFLPKNVASRKSCHPFHHHQHQASQERSLRLERMREFQEFERQQAEQEARHHKSDSATYQPGQNSSRPITTSWEILKCMVIVLDFAPQNVLNSGSGILICPEVDDFKFDCRLLLSIRSSASGKLWLKIHKPKRLQRGKVLTHLNL